jgi:BioD-like phosphotransacetylase family protein
MAKKPEKGKETALPQAPKYAEAIARFTPHLKAEVEAIMAQEETIEKLLKDKKNADLLVRNPAEFFQKAKVKLPELVGRRIATFDLDKQLEASQFVLPNGSVIKPNVKINLK